MLPLLLRAKYHFSGAHLLRCLQIICITNKPEELNCYENYAQRGQGYILGKKEALGLILENKKRV